MYYEVSRALPVLPPRRLRNFPRSTSSDNIYETIPDQKNSDMESKNKNVYTGEPNFPDNTSTTIIHAAEQDLPEDEGDNGELHDADYAYTSVPESQAKKNHISGSDKSDVVVKEGIISGGKCKPSLGTSNTSSNDKSKSYGEKIIDDSGYLMPNAQTSNPNDPNQKPSHGIRVDQNDPTINSNQDESPDFGSKSQKIDNTGSCKSSLCPTQKPEIEHTYFGLHDLLSESSSKSLITGDHADNALSVESEPENDDYIPNFDIKSNARPAASDGTLQHPYLNITKSQKQPCSATMSSSDQSHIFPSTGQSIAPKAFDDPELSVTGEMHCPEQSVRKTTSVRCDEEDGKSQGTHVDEYGYLVLEETVVNVDGDDDDDDGESNINFPGIDRSVMFRSSQSISSSQFDEEEDGMGITHTYFGLADLLANPLNVPSPPGNRGKKDEIKVRSGCTESETIHDQYRFSNTATAFNTDEFGYAVLDDSVMDNSPEEADNGHESPLVDESGYFVPTPLKRSLLKGSSAVLLTRDGGPKQDTFCIGNKLVTECVGLEDITNATSKEEGGGGTRSPLVDDTGYLVPNAMMHSLSKGSSPALLTGEDALGNDIRIETGIVIQEDTGKSIGKGDGDEDKRSPVIDDTGYPVPNALMQSLSTESSSAPLPGEDGQEKNAFGTDIEAGFVSQEGTSKEDGNEDKRFPLVDDMGYLVPSTLEQPLSKETSALFSRKPSPEVLEQDEPGISNRNEAGFVSPVDTTTGTTKEDGGGDEKSFLPDDMGYVVGSTQEHPLSEESPVVMSAVHDTEKDTPGSGNEEESEYPILESTPRYTSNEEGQGDMSSSGSGNGGWKSLIPDDATSGTSKEKVLGDKFSSLVDDMGYILASQRMKSSSQEMPACFTSDHGQEENTLGIGNTNGSASLILEDAAAGNLKEKGHGGKTSPVFEDMGTRVSKTLKQPLSWVLTALLAKDHDPEEVTPGIVNVGEDTRTCTSNEEVEGDVTSKGSENGGRKAPIFDGIVNLIPNVMQPKPSSDNVTSPRVSFTNDHDQERNTLRGPTGNEGDCGHVDSAVQNSFSDILQDETGESGPESPLSDDVDDLVLEANVSSSASLDVSLLRSGNEEIDEEDGKRGEDTGYSIP